MRILGTVFLIGAGVIAAGAVIAAPRILRAARPLVRDGLKRGMEVYERVRGAAAEFSEDVEDLVAEVKSEITTPAAARSVEKT